MSHSIRHQERRRRRAKQKAPEGMRGTPLHALRSKKMIRHGVEIQTIVRPKSQ